MEFTNTSRGDMAFSRMMWSMTILRGHGFSRFMSIAAKRARYARTNRLLYFLKWGAKVLYTRCRSLSLTPSMKGDGFRIGRYSDRVTWSTENSGQMMLRFDQHPPEVVALPEFELYQVVADAEVRTGAENFDLPKKIIIRTVSLIQVFLKKDILGYLVVNFLPPVKLIPELRKKRPHVERG